MNAKLGVIKRHELKKRWEHETVFSDWLATDGLGQLAKLLELDLCEPIREVSVGNYKADIVVEKILILELKAVSTLVARHEAQLVNYLTVTGVDDGLLINFGAPSLQFKHKYRNYVLPQNPVNPVNPVSQK